MADRSAGSTEPLRVLVVEGSPIARQLLASELGSLGHDVATARDADEAWQHLGEQAADVVLVDWPDGGAEVPELCRRVRGREAGGERPYTWIAVTPPPSGRANVEAALEAGADAFLLKPIDAVALRAALVAAARFVRLDGAVRAARADAGRRETEVREEARRDPLTRLGNRVRLTEDLRRIRSGAQRYGQRWVAVMIDVDQLRRYNESLGRPAGDELLRQVARAIRRTVRDGDGAYRADGDRFLLLLPEQDEDGGVIVAHRCRAAVKALAIPHPRSDAGSQVTISAGVAGLHGSTAPAIDDWLRRADLALDAAKAAGRNGVARSEHTHLAGSGLA